ncbi:MAG: hypothetical protein ABFD18_14350 [Syntrophomonas sp.]
MENENLLMIINDFLKKNPPPYFSFDIGGNIPHRKLKNVHKTYASYDMYEEKPIILIDDTVFRSAKLGMLVTNKHLFFRLKSDLNSWTIKNDNIPLNEINQLKIRAFNKGSNLFINGTKTAYISAFGSKGFQRREKDILNSLFEIIIEALPHSKIPGDNG